LTIFNTFDSLNYMALNNLNVIFNATWPLNYILGNVVLVSFNLGNSLFLSVERFVEDLDYQRSTLFFLWK